MVRFYWHVDDGCSAHVPVNGVTLANSEPTRLAVEMDVPGVAGSAVGMLNMPPCTTEGKSPLLRNIGIVIAHDVDAAFWQGPLLNSIAQCLAKKGFIVMRNYCNLKELRRLRMFEKALDTVSKSPYATSAGVDSWLLGELDARCSAASMSAFLRQIRPQQPGPRFAIIPAVNESLLGTDDAILNARTLVCKALLEFAEGLPVVTGADVDLPSIPSVHSDACMLPPPPPQCAGALGVILDLPMQQDPSAVAAEHLGHPSGMPESFPVQGSPNQLLTPRVVGGQLPSAQPPLVASGLACAQPTVQAQHAVGVDAQHILAMQSQNVMGVRPQVAMGVDGPIPFVAPLPLAAGQLATLPATLVAPAAAVLNENAMLSGIKAGPAMPLFRAEEGQMQPPDYQ